MKNYIREWRRHRELGTNKLAKMSGVSASMISKLERGLTTVTETTLVKLAEALQIEPWQLIAYPPALRAEFVTKLLRFEGAQIAALARGLDAFVFAISEEE